MAGRHRRVAAPPGFPRRATPVASAPTLPLTIEMTDGYPNVTHHVRDESMADGRRAGGRYQAISGARVFSPSVTTPVWRRCPTRAMWASS